MKFVFLEVGFMSLSSRERDGQVNRAKKKETDREKAKGNGGREDIIIERGRY